MKVTSLYIENIGVIPESSIMLDKPLILFYGEIRQGKSTILNCVKWVCGGAFPQDIIRHGQQEGSIELAFDNGSISRSFYRAKDGSTKAHEVVYIRDSKPVKSPVAEIKRLLNPFLLDQDFLRNKTELERRQFFIELFGVDTSELDKELTSITSDAKTLRAKIDGYGDIDLTAFAPVDIEALRSQLATVRAEHGRVCATLTEENRKAETHNATVERGERSLADVNSKISQLEEALADAKVQRDEIAGWLAANAKLPIAATPDAPDTSGLETEIQNASAANVRAEQYQKNKARAESREKDNANLLSMERRAREIRTEKQSKLRGISDSCGIDGLSFDEDGNFIYQNTAAGMISDSQIMRLSSELSSLYPEGFGLDLIDRGESLGKSIFEFVDRAKAENKTIMATIVGEKPATVPENIGVFVVSEGMITATTFEPEMAEVAA